MTEERANTSEKPEFVRRRRPARRAMLEAARRILVRDGSDELSPEAVIKETGYSPEIVYAYFCNKDELLLSIAADELSALSRAARQTEGSDAAPSEGMGILDLPKMVESFIAARAATAGDDAETDEADSEAEGESEAEPDTDEIPAAKGEVKAEPARDTRLETLPRETPRARGQNTAPREIDGIVKELAARDGQGETSVPAAVARLERRVYVIERSLAEQAEKMAHKAAEPMPVLSGEFGALSGRIGALEKRIAEICDEFSSSQKSNSDRLRILEATPPAGPSSAENVPGTLEAPVLLFDEFPGDPPPSGGGGNGAEASFEDFLAAARDAARNAATETSRIESHGGHSLVSRWKHKVRDLLGGAAHADRKFLLTRVAPIPVVAIGLIITTWTAMDAGELAATENRESAMVSPGTVVALSTTPAPMSALDQLLASAELGDIEAQTALGLNYLNGAGVTVNETEAVRWLQDAAEGGQPVAQYYLGSIYARADSAIHDSSLARYWYMSAAERGNRMAMNNLAVYYAQGVDATPDIGEAAHWFAMAAALGFKVAQFNLAVLYERGDGVPQDFAEAYKWYLIAAAQGDADAAERAAFLAGSLEPETASAIAAEAAAFQPAPMDARANDAPALSLKG
jgi:AcrR family transcriptional regulator